MTPLFRSPSWPRLAALAASLILSACGGGGGGGGGASDTSSAQTPTTPTTPTTPSTPVTTAPDPIPTENTWLLNNICATPRTGTAADGTAYHDSQGTVLDEMKFLRSWADNYYLWYNEIPSTIHMADYTNPVDYFAVLKTTALTASGQTKDRFHFTYTTTEWDALTNESKEVGYGLTWSRNATSGTAPRTWLAAIVEPGSPAAAAGIVRGDMLVAVDGIDFINTSDKAGVDKLNAGLFPDNAGEVHKLSIRRAGATLDINLTSAEVTSNPVTNVKVIDAASGKVGYLTFNDHNAVSEKKLADAFTTLKSAGVTDLVLDMRYNGGGLVYVASELAYMIAGPNAAGKTFENLVYNDKTPPQSPVPFLTTAYGFAAPNPIRAGTALPTLGLKHVSILTGIDTCSASESVINGLRGVDVQVDLIGGRTCGKPYGFTPTDNCGTTYFSIEFRGTNAKGEGDYADGFAPTCTVSDDLSHALGDTSENQLAAALAYRTTKTCPAASGASARTMKLVRPEVKEIAIFPKTRRH